MIGQTKLKSDLDALIDENIFPRFSIFVGPTGSGKRTLCESHIADRLNMFWCFEQDNKVDTVRKVIEDAYRVTSPTMYIFTDADNMSAQAKNALLKVTEEPPNNAYFILTITDLNQTLPTIRSRAQIFRMDPYTPTEIGEYANSIGIIDSAEMEVIADICETPGEVNILSQSGIIAFDEFMELVADNIAEVSCANAFKIGDKIKFKDGDGYDLRLFLKAFMSKCIKRMSASANDAMFIYAQVIKITSKYLQELNITGINKQSTFDCWMLDVREVMLNGV